MPLTRDQKREALADIQAALDDATSVYLTDYQGLTVDETNHLRRAFREVGVDFRVLKNTLVRRAMESRGGYDELYDELNGPTAVAFTTDPASPAKVLTKFLKDFDKEVPRFKGAFIEGAIYREGQLDALASLKSKDELVADVLSLLLAPIRNISGAVSAPGSQLAAAIQTIAEKAEA